VCRLFAGIPGRSAPHPQPGRNGGQDLRVQNSQIQPQTQQYRAFPRVILEKEREAKRAATLASIHEGKVVDGVVKNITEYGVFVDLGGVDGLLHITDISWGRVKHPSELFQVGDEITVKILNLDLEKERVSLGMKQLTPDPWTTAAEKYPVGSRVTGRVVSLTDYGAFVELEEGSKA
jgi:small subunit ribosomal protein S1